MFKTTLRGMCAVAAVALTTAGCAATAGTNDESAPQAAYAVPAITTQFDAGENALPQFAEPADDDLVALIVTQKGNILLRFCPDGAPKAVENFLTHAKEGYYDGVVFHRIIDNFMIQGGDPEGTGAGGESIWGEGFELETTLDLFHFRGALCMAHSSLPNSNGSQFYIVQGNVITDETAAQMTSGGWPEPAVAKYREVGGYPMLDQQYTVFGQVLGGIEIVDAIAKGEVTGAQGDQAKDPVVMDKVAVMTYKEAKAQAGKA